ncbi:MAG: DUF748 domain-containing protein [Deltaproteobacteria bacterium]|nr:DUF748 domain-containing protein [Deltaproteobacteria bacterium]
MKGSLLRKVFWAIIAAVALYAFIGFVAAPLALKKVALNKIKGLTGKPAAIEQIRINPFALTLTVRGFSIGEASPPILAVKEFHANLEARSLIDRAVLLKEVRVDGLAMTIERREDGSIVVIPVVPAPPASPKTNGGALPPLRVTETTLSEGTITFVDRAVGRQAGGQGGPARTGIAAITLAVKNLSTLPRERGHLALSFQDKQDGFVRIEGPFSLVPIDADMTVMARSLSLLPLQPYLQEKAGLILAGGALSLETTTVVSIDEAGRPTRLEGKGAAELSDLILLNADGKEDLLQVSKINIREIDGRYSPPGLSVGAIALSGLSGRIHRRSDGSLNLPLQPSAGISSEEKAALPAEKRPQKIPAPAGAAMNVGAITLEDGRLRYVDDKVSPSYEATLQDISASLSAPSPATEERSIKLKGLLNGAAPFSLAGLFRPVAEPLSLDANISLANFDLSAMTPYSGTYLGYALDRGKLSLNLRWNLAGRQLDTRNVLVIERFALGKKVESPEAMNIPLELAVALLTDRQGKIDLDVPVTGTLDDPKFSIGYFILKIIGNIIEKAVTAPFRLLASLAGGDSDLGSIPFDPGESIAKPDARKKLDALIEALYNRPMIKLEILGRADASRDGESLRRKMLVEQVKSLKRQRLIDTGKPAPLLERISLDATEYERYVRQLAGPPATPASPPSKPQAAPRAEPSFKEIEAVLLSKILLPDDRMRKLAEERAAVARDYLIQSNKVEKERIFLMDVTTAADSEAKTPEKAGVMFNLR